MSFRLAALWGSFGATGISLVLSGCGDAGPGERLGQSGEAVTFVPQTFTNDQTAYDYFVGKGLTNFQAAGIVGNLDQESGVDPSAVQSGGPGRGIAQWSVGGRWDTDANDNATWYAAQQGQSVWSLQLQLDFIWFELTNVSYYGLATLKATTNVTDATVAFETDFEGCGTCNQSQRIAYAQSVLSAYGSVEYAAQFVSQSFPLATTTMTMTAGQVTPSYIELKNVGTKTWDSNTRIATTQPRDRKSAFADGTWVADDRPSAVQGTVPPGSTYKFTFDLAAPNTAGSYDEFFGVVQEGVAWFSDPGQGGPPDNDLEVKIDVAAAPPGTDAGSPKDAGAHTDAGHTDAGTHADAGQTDSGTLLGGDDAGVSSAEGDGGWNGFGDGSSGGCAVGGAGTRGAAPPWTGAVGLLVALGAILRGRAAARRD